MAIDLDKMRAAEDKMIEARDLLDEAFLDASDAAESAACIYAMRDALDDLGLDIARAEGGDLE